MASRRGMIARSTAAQVRIDTALAVIKEQNPDLPDYPARVRDPNMANALRMEWTADVLEALAGTAPDTNDVPEPVADEDRRDPEALAKRNMPDLRQIALDAGVDAAELDAAPNKDAVVALIEAANSTPDAPEGAAEAIDPMSLTLADLKTIAIDAGADADAVNKMRTKKDVLAQIEAHAPTEAELQQRLAGATDEPEGE